VQSAAMSNDLPTVESLFNESDVAVVGYLFIFGGSIYRLPETGLGKYLRAKNSTL